MQLPRLSAALPRSRKILQISCEAEGATCWLEEYQENIDGLNITSYRCVCPPPEPTEMPRPPPNTARPPPPIQPREPSIVEDPIPDNFQYPPLPPPNSTSDRFQEENNSSEAAVPPDISDAIAPSPSPADTIVNGKVGCPHHPSMIYLSRRSFFQFTMLKIALAYSLAECVCWSMGWSHISGIDWCLGCCKHYLVCNLPLHSRRRKN